MAGNAVDLESRLMFSVFEPGYGRTNITQNRRIRVRNPHVTLDVGLIRDVCRRRTLGTDLDLVGANGRGMICRGGYRECTALEEREKGEARAGPEPWVSIYHTLSYDVLL